MKNTEVLGGNSEVLGGNEAQKESFQMHFVSTSVACVFHCSQSSLLCRYVWVSSCNTGHCSQMERIHAVCQ